MNRHVFRIVQSGDGYEITNSAGEIIAWTMDLAWAALIVEWLQRQVAYLAGEPKNGFEKSVLSS